MSGVGKSPSPSREISGNEEIAFSKSMSPPSMAEEGAVANSEPRSGKSLIIVAIVAEVYSAWLCSRCRSHGKPLHVGFLLRIWKKCGAKLTYLNK